MRIRLNHLRVQHACNDAMTTLTIHLSSNRSPPEWDILGHIHRKGAAVAQVLAVVEVHTKHTLRTQHTHSGVNRSFDSIAVAALVESAAAEEVAANLGAAENMQVEE